MKCILLTAGYGTRLYPLTKDVPKCLLEYKGKTILECLLENMDKNIEKIIVTNDHFFKQFNDFYLKNKEKYNITKVYNDGTKTPEERLGAVGDLIATLKKEDDDDFLVAGTDNILDFSLDEFINNFNKNPRNLVMTHFEFRSERLKKTGVARIDTNGKIYYFEEKPTNPPSVQAIPPFYIFTKETVKMLKEHDYKLDSLGELIELIYNDVDIYAMAMPGKRITFNTLDEYKKLAND